MISDLIEGAKDHVKDEVNYFEDFVKEDPKDFAKDKFDEGQDFIKDYEKTSDDVQGI